MNTVNIYIFLTILLNFLVKFYPIHYGLWDNFLSFFNKFFPFVIIYLEGLLDNWFTDKWKYSHGQRCQRGDP